MHSCIYAHKGTRTCISFCWITSICPSRFILLPFPPCLWSKSLINVDNPSGFSWLLESLSRKVQRSREWDASLQCFISLPVSTKAGCIHGPRWQFLLPGLFSPEGCSLPLSFQEDGDNKTLLLLSLGHCSVLCGFSAAFLYLCKLFFH